MPPTGTPSLLIYSPESLQPYGHCHDYVTGLGQELARLGIAVTVLAWEGSQALAAPLRTVPVRQPPYARRPRSGYRRLGPLGDILWGVNRTRSELMLLRAFRRVANQRPPTAMLFESFEYVALARFLSHHGHEAATACIFHDTNFNTRHASPIAAAYKHLMRRFVRRIVAGVDVALVHGPEMRANLVDAARLGSRYGDRVEVIPYGAPEPDAVPHLGRAEARRRLGVPEGAPLLLAFGTLRSDKRLDLVVQSIGGAPEWHLLVAGPEGDVSYASLQALVDDRGVRSRTWLRPGFVPAEEHPLYFAAADIVVALYDGRARHESGTAQLARCFLRPVIAAGGPDLEEYVRATGAGWWLDPPDATRLAQLLTELAHTSAWAGHDLIERIRLAATARSWRAVAASLAGQLFRRPVSAT